MDWETIMDAETWVEEGEHRPGNPDFPSAKTFMRWVTSLVDALHNAEVLPVGVYEEYE